MKRDIAFARTLRKRMTPEEVKLWVREWRQSRGYHFRRQESVDGYVLDFLRKSLSSPDFGGEPAPAKPGVARKRR